MKHRKSNVEYHLPAVLYLFLNVFPCFNQCEQSSLTWCSPWRIVWRLKSLLVFQRIIPHYNTVLQYKEVRNKPFLVFTCVHSTNLLLLVLIESSESWVPSRTSEDSEHSPPELSWISSAFTQLWSRTAWLISTPSISSKTSSSWGWKSAALVFFVGSIHPTFEVLLGKNFHSHEVLRLVSLSCLLLVSEVMPVCVEDCNHYQYWILRFQRCIRMILHIANHKS